MRYILIFSLFTVSPVLMVQLHPNSHIEAIIYRNNASDPNFSEMCRVSRGLYLHPEFFDLYTCADCYYHVDDALFVKGLKFTRKDLITIQDPITNKTYFANRTDSQSAIWKSFSSEKGKFVWTKCCEAAENCCRDMLSTPHYFDAEHCPRTWDGWDCWPDTPVGQTAESPCPHHIYFNNEPPSCTRYATKICEINGTWYHNEQNNEWTNYTTCQQKNVLKITLRTHIVTMGISVVLLIPALIILFHFKQLRSFRISIHKNLFMALLLNDIFVIIYEGFFILDLLNNNGNTIIESNGAGCKLFYTALRYLRLCTYAWMFCEGFYLHKLIAAAFAEQKSMLMFYVIGWSFPVIPVGVWALLRQMLADEGCWSDPAGHYEWVLYTPMLLSLLVNLGFMINIIRVLITKLKSTHANEPTQFRRAFRATFILIPLFGLHFLFLIYHPKGGCLFVQIINNVTYAIDGLQGGLIAILFCYNNSEILYLLKRTYKRRQLIRDIGSHTASKRTTRATSRGSLSTNASIVPDYPLAQK